MPVIVDDALAEAKSRLALITLTTLTLQLMERWRLSIHSVSGERPDYESTMIMGAIIVISAEKLMRRDVESELESLARPFPYERLTRCNVSSIAAITGLNRETVRRKVHQLEIRNLVVRERNSSIHIAHGLLQLPVTLTTVCAQLDVLTRAANHLLRVGVFEFQESK